MPARFNELLKSNEDNRRKFSDYERDCSNFIIRFRETLASYLGCPNSKINWLSLKEPADDQADDQWYLGITRDKKMILSSDAFYLFVFTMVLAPDNVMNPIEVKITFKVRRTEEGFVVKFRKEHTIHKDDQQRLLNEFTEYLYNELKRYLETEFETFLKGKPRPLGFQTTS